MSLGEWIRRRLFPDRRIAASDYKRPSVDGCPVLLQRLDAEGGSKVVEALAERYEVVGVEGEDELLYRVEVDDARFPDEAVVRLACLLDEIDPGWQSRFAWPKQLD